MQRRSTRGWLTAAVVLAASPLAAVLVAQSILVGSDGWAFAAVLAGCASVGLAVLVARVATRKLAQDAGPRAAAEEASSSFKDEFLTSLGHELRNPLGAIAAAVDVLDSRETQGETAAEARAIIARQTRHLAHIVNDLLDVSRLLNGKTVLVRQPLDLAALVRRVRHTIALTVPVQAHRLSCRLDSAWTSGDTVRLEQVVSSLAMSALKSAAPADHVELAVRREGSTALLVVKGCGQGLAPDLLMRRMVELHGGTLDAESSASGNQFTMRLPAVEPVAAHDEELLPLLKRRQVLVVDDNQDVLAAVRAKLELDGHTVSTSTDGHDGLSRLLRQRPEVSIIGVGLPGLTGYELARHARAAGYAGRMIALSGDGHERDVANAMVAGFDACLLTPVDRLQLRASMSAD